MTAAPYKLGDKVWVRPVLLAVRTHRLWVRGRVIAGPIPGETGVLVRTGYGVMLSYPENLRPRKGWWK